MNREALRSLAEALPVGTALPVPREWLLELLAAAPGSAHVCTEGLLTVDQAAARLSLSKGYLYRKAKSLPFTRKLSRRELRFDPTGLDQWLRAKSPGSAKST